MNNVIHQFEIMKRDIKQTDKLYSLFNSINNYPLIHFTMRKGTSLLRQRLNKKNEFFTNVSQLYCPPANCLPSYGRANLPYQPMLYVSTFASDTKAYPPRLITLMEISDFVKNKESKGIERSTCSLWINIEPLNLISLPFSEYENACSDIKHIQNLWDKLKESNTLCSEAIEIIEYMSNEISRPVTQNSDYFIISNFVNFLLNVNQSTCSADGIIYPSVSAKGNGFNIAIKKESADKKIIFKHASLCLLIKNKMKSTYLLMNDSDSLCRDGNLKYIQRKILLSDGDNIYNYNEINELFIN